MTPPRRPRELTTLRDHVHVVARHRWLALAPILLVPLAAVLLSLRQAPLYEASAEVLLGHQNLAAMLTGTQDPSVYQQADRVAQTQADLARVPTVAERTLAAANLEGRSAAELLSSSSVTARNGADLLQFRVRDERQATAVLLASEYARQFTLFRLELDTAALQRARAEVEDRIAQLERAGDTTSSLYASFVDKAQQLRTMEALQTSNAYVVRAADGAVKVRPTPVRNGLLGLAVGIVVGIGLAYLRHALDTRVRTAEEVAEELDLPLLARLPAPRRRDGNPGLAMLTDPSGAQAESYRMLRANFEFLTRERDAQSIMVTSAVESEGKSTTAANLAAALALSGRRVLLVDLDLRRPAIGRLVGLAGRPGVTDVALGECDLDQAIVRLAASRAGGTLGPPESNGHDSGKAVLQVLTAGTAPLQAGEFMASRSLAGILAELRERADIVLIDAPPLLGIGDSLALSAHVDALVVVIRLKVVRHGMLGELRRLLEASPARALGFAVTGAPREGGYDSAYGYGYAPRRGGPAPEAAREPVS